MKNSKFTCKNFLNKFGQQVWIMRKILTSLSLVVASNCFFFIDIRINFMLSVLSVIWNPIIRNFTTSYNEFLWSHENFLANYYGNIYNSRICNYKLSINQTILFRLLWEKPSVIRTSTFLLSIPFAELCP